MIEFRTGRFEFGPVKGGPQADDKTEAFSNPIKSFAVILTGFQLAFVKKDDEEIKIDEHPLHLANLDVEGTKIDDNIIEVNCRFALRDASKYYDDLYNGYVAYTVIAEI